MPLGVTHHRGSYEQKNINDTAVWSGTVGTQITGGASHTLGASFTEIFSATTVDTFWVQIIVHNTSGSATQTDQLLNIYTGAASSEQVLIPNLLSGWSDTQSSGLRKPRCYHFPLYIPAGTRITAKVQGLIASDTVRVVMCLRGGGTAPTWVGKRVECLGAVTASSRGTSVTPGGASEGSFTDIGTSTYDYGYILPMIQGTMTDTITTRNWTSIDVGVGGSLYKNLECFYYCLKDTESSSMVNGGMGRFTFIPSGTLLQLRGQNSGTAEAYDAVIYGVY